jgi:hypothetical protein
MRKALEVSKIESEYGKYSFLSPEYASMTYSRGDEKDHCFISSSS